IGTFLSPEVALQGFHAQAGWIAFCLIAIGAIALSKKLRFFNADGRSHPLMGSREHLAAALLVPFLALVAVRMVTSGLSTGFDAFYPVGVLIAVIVLIHFRKQYTNLGWEINWCAPAIGTAVFIIWMLLEPAGSENPLAQRLEELPTWLAASWLVFRVFGSVFTVPLVEELAFRGYLMRKLISSHFETVSFKQFTLFSFILSSVLFGMLHERWLAATLAGMGYALALHRRGRLGDAVVAHMTTNGLIALVVLIQSRWSLWV
ncbi:MAG: exosortase E/protease, VPEID-CTERM system, partial [Gammaproteobacteria bacterium]